MGPKIYGFVILGPRFCDSACGSCQSQGLDQGLVPGCSMWSGAGLLYLLCFRYGRVALLGSSSFFNNGSSFQLVVVCGAAVQLCQLGDGDVVDVSLSFLCVEVIPLEPEFVQAAFYQVSVSPCDMSTIYCESKWSQRQLVLLAS